MAVVAPMAQWRPLTRAMSTTALRHDIICLHTMVGTLSGSWSWSNRPGGSYWHFGIGGGGAIWQCQDLRYRSAANLNGNHRVIPIETEDHGTHFSSWSGRCGDVPAWTNAQINAIVDLVAWLCARYSIPATLIADTRPGRRGIAYHRQGIDPWRCGVCEKWSNATGKCCPDNRRINQLINTVIPRVRARLGGGTLPPPPPPPGGSFMSALTDAEQKQLYTWIKGIAISTVPMHQDTQFANHGQDGRFMVQTLVNRAVKSEINDIRKEVADLRQRLIEHDTGHRVVRDGWKSGDPVYHSDLKSYIYQVRQNGPWDTLKQNLRTLVGLSPNAIRLPVDVVDDMIRELPFVDVDTDDQAPN